MKRLLQLFVRLLGAALVCGVLWYAAHETSSLQKGDWLHLASIYIIGFGLIGVMFSSHQIDRIFGAVKNLFESPSLHQAQYENTQRQLVAMCESFYREGPAGLRKFQGADRMPQVWKNILAQMDAHIPIVDIQELVKFEAKQQERELQARIEIFSSLVSLAPSLGMLGTVMGLVKLLAELQDFSALGSNMALALMTTLYGIGFSVVVLSPLVSRLENIKEAKLRNYFQVFFWLRLVEQRKPAYYCEPTLLMAPGGSGK